MARYSLAKKHIKILLLGGVHESAVTVFVKDGHISVESLPDSLSEKELKKKIKDVYMIGIRSATYLSAEVLECAEKLIAIGCFCIGTNQVDLKYAKKRGIPVFNAPYSNTRSVAELVTAEIIMLTRGIPEKNIAAHKGIWIKSAKDSHEVRGKKLGIIGYGRIGTQVGILAENLGMQVYYYDIEEKLPLGNVKHVKKIEQLLSTVDVVTLHVPQTKETLNMIGKQELALMKEGATLINASRGNVVDINALVRALEKDHIKGAAIDVFPEEPKSKSEKFVSKLCKFDNVILTPHIGGSTMEAQENIGKEVAQKLVKYSNNGSTLSAVNFAEVSLPEHKGRNRLLHIHKNIPGVLASINEMFSADNINISGQYLQTDSDVGYVVIDIEDGKGKAILNKLQNIKGTIKSRILY